MNILVLKFKEVIYAVLPVIFIVTLLHFTLTPLSMPLIARFGIGTVLVIVGLAVFLFGVDVGLTPVGNAMGAALSKTNKLWIVIGAGILLGFFISIAEPDLHILAGQIELVTDGLISKAAIVAVVSVGIALFMSAGLVRIVYNYPLYKLLTLLYLVILILSLLTSKEFLAIAFDSSGATTGALTVPFILALAIGVAELKKDRKASENDSFGLVAVASAGAIIAVLVMSIVSKSDKISGSLNYSDIHSSSIILPFIKALPLIFAEILIALTPILIIFLIMQKMSIKMSKRTFKKRLVGFALTLAGLVLFLTGVNAGFMEVGSIVGYEAASLGNKSYVIIVGFVLGFVTILAEPAVHVLTLQIEEVTSGYVKRRIVLGFLSIGVSLAVGLSMIRILIPGIQLWHYLLPGYLIAVLMSYLTPKLFVGIAFDSGGVASGPMTATFILAFAHGVAEATEGADVLVDGFGMIAMVALMPIIAIQALGLIYKIKSKKTGGSDHGAA